VASGAGFRRVGVFGGTFDPPHVGHLIVARDAAEALVLDRVLLVVAGRPPHKSLETHTPPELRHAMVRAAVDGDPVLTASDMELRRPGPSYTVDTLAEVQRTYPGSELYLLIGVDQWKGLGGWKDPRGIGERATVAVMARSGEDPLAGDPGVGVACTPVPVTRVDLSSSQVRARVRDGRSIRYLVPAAVEEMIHSNALYRSSRSVTAAAR
jgi:nicotinate-nucleotide adenylyltransferase